MLLQIMTIVLLMNITGSGGVFIPGGQSLMYTVTFQLTTTRLTINISYNHNFLMKISAFLPVCDLIVFFLHCI